MADERDYQRDVEDDTPTTTREVHRYPFRTSRYGNFESQVLSYQLLVDELDPLLVLKEANFEIKKPLLASDISIASNILGGGDELMLDYADYFERVIQGALKLGTLQPAISNEFNNIIDLNTGNILGVWIRCPEPYNDPKIPKTEMETSIRLSINGDGESNYKSIFSKDCREVFITNSDNSLNMPIGTYSFTFEYKEWNGHAYEVAVSVPVIITN